MIKIKVKANTSDEYIRIVGDITYKFSTLKSTARNDVLERHYSKGNLYARTIYNPEPIHFFNGGDLIKIEEINRKMMRAHGVDCANDSWVGMTQTVPKSDVQLLLLKEVKQS